MNRHTRLIPAMLMVALILMGCADYNPSADRLASCVDRWNTSAARDDLQGVAVDHINGAASSWSRHHDNGGRAGCSAVFPLNEKVLLISLYDGLPSKVYWLDGSDPARKELSDPSTTPIRLHEDGTLYVEGPADS